MHAMGLLSWFRRRKVSGAVERVMDRSIGSGEDVGAPGVHAVHIGLLGSHQQVGPAIGVHVAVDARPDRIADQGIRCAVGPEPATGSPVPSQHQQTALVVGAKLAER